MTFGLAQRFFCRVHQVLLQKRLADAVALRLQEGERHAAPDDERVDLGDDVAQHVDLGGHLGAADHRHQGFFGLFQRLFEIFNLVLEQKARRALPGVAGDRLVGGVTAVCGRERVVDVHVAH